MAGSLGGVWVGCWVAHLVVQSVKMLVLLLAVWKEQNAAATKETCLAVWRAGLMELEMAVSSGVMKDRTKAA